MRVLVCGGREYGYIPRGTMRRTPAWYAALKQLEAERAVFNERLGSLSPRPTLIIHGAAHGADELAATWAKQHGVPDLPFRANWYPRGRKGGLDKSAGPLRNGRMIREGKPDLVLAFPGGKGTADCVRQALDAGVEVIEVPRPSLR